jgi:hypothetical protein
MAVAVAEVNALAPSSDRTDTTSSFHFRFSVSSLPHNSIVLVCARPTSSVRQIQV